MDKQNSAEVEIKVDAVVDGGVVTEKERLGHVRKANNTVTYLLSTGDRSRQELFDKVFAKKVPSHIIDEVLDEYEDGGYIDDVNYTEKFIYHKMAYDSLGREGIKRKLLEKGVARDIIDGALQKIGEEAFEEEAYKISFRKARMNANSSYRNRVNQIVGLLGRKGYNPDIALRVARQSIKEADEGLSN